MLKKLMVTGLLLVSVVMAESKGSSSRVGVGVDDSNFLYATFDLSKNLRFEPAIHFSTTETTPNNETEQMNYKLRVFALGNMDKNKQFYYGATFEDYDTENQNGLTIVSTSYFTATAGLEYSLSKQVTISGEAGLALFGDASGIQSSLILKYYFE